MAKKTTKKASARRRAKASPRDRAPRKSSRGGVGAGGPLSPPRSKWELSELDGVKN